MTRLSVVLGFVGGMLLQSLWSQTLPIKHSRLAGPVEVRVASPPEGKAWFEFTRVRERPVRIEERRRTLPLGPLPPRPRASGRRTLAATRVVPPETTLAAAVKITKTSALSSIGTGSSVDLVLEPTLARKGDQVLVTGNWFASYSSNGGGTFLFVDPFTLFPATRGGEFCCDQVAVYDESHDLFIWYLQYEQNQLGNVGRIAIATGKGIKRLEFSYYDVNSEAFGTWRREWFDFPELVVAGDYLYLSTNLYRVNSEDFTRAALLRIPLGSLAARAQISVDYIETTDVGGLRPVHGASSTMYFAAHVNPETLRVFSWPVHATKVQYSNLSVQGWTPEPFSSSTPDGSEWLGRVDGRITAAWKSGAEIGFLWSAAGDANFVHPHVRAAVIDVSTMTVKAEPHIYSRDFSLVLPAVGVNQAGLAGISLFYSSTQQHPSAAVGVFDGNRWQLTSAVIGTNSPSQNRWGDYGAVRPVPNSNEWETVTYVLMGGGQGGNVSPYLIRFTF